MVVEQIVQRCLFREFCDRCRTVVHDLIWIEPQQMQFCGNVLTRLHPTFEVNAQVKVEVIDPVPKALNRTAAVHGTSCAPNFKTTCLIPILLISLAIDHRMNEAFGLMVSPDFVDFYLFLETARNRLIQAGVNRAQMLSE